MWPRGSDEDHNLHISDLRGADEEGQIKANGTHFGHLANKGEDVLCHPL